MKGSKGNWKEFLSVYDSKFGVSLSDPARRSTDSLVAFLTTFSEDDLKVTDNSILCTTGLAFSCSSNEIWQML